MGKELNNTVTTPRSNCNGEMNSQRAVDRPSIFQFWGSFIDTFWFRNRGIDTRAISLTAHLSITVVLAQIHKQQTTKRNSQLANCVLFSFHVFYTNSCISFEVIRLFYGNLFRFDFDWHKDHACTPHHVLVGTSLGNHSWIAFEKKSKLVYLWRELLYCMRGVGSENPLIYLPFLSFQRESTRPTESATGCHRRRLRSHRYVWAHRQGRPGL